MLHKMRGKAGKRGDRIKVAFVYYSFTSFVKTDYEILSKHFDVRKVNYRRFRDAFRVLIAVLKSDVSFSWFAGGHAFLAVLFSKIFRKKSIVIVGGGDVACEPEINYGQFTLGWHKKLYTKFVLKHADKVLVVDPSLKEDAIKNAKVSGRNIKTVPTGYEAKKFKMDGKKENLIITVALANSWKRVQLKGLDTFVRAAKLLPNVKFLIIGVQEDILNKIQSIAPSNVSILTPLSQSELIFYYQKAKVYCQLSVREGLPNALCEAMLCECVPVGTDVQGVRTAIGDTGFYVPYGDPRATVEAIKNALRSDKGIKARERIKMMFPIERREKELKEIITSLVEESVLGNGGIGS